MIIKDAIMIYDFLSAVMTNIKGIINLKNKSPSSLHYFSHSIWLHYQLNLIEQRIVDTINKILSINQLHKQFFSIRYRTILIVSSQNYTF